MLNADDPLPLTQQCQLPQVSRSSAYYKPVPTSGETLELMRVIDELYLERPRVGPA
ncbi:MAG: hypothetical protein Pars93KO_08980 [Parasphingorhabdus sp.]